MGTIKFYPVQTTIQVNGPGTNVLEQRFIAKPYRYSTIDSVDLANHISADSKIERSKVQVITDSLIKQIEEMVLNGHAIKVPHLGMFRPAIKSKSTEKEQDVTAADMTAHVNFLPSVELKEKLKSVRLEKLGPQYFVGTYAQEIGRLFGSNDWNFGFVQSLQQEDEDNTDYFYIFVAYKEVQGAKTNYVLFTRNGRPAIVDVGGGEIQTISPCPKIWDKQAVIDSISAPIADGGWNGVLLGTFPASNAMYGEEINEVQPS